MKIWVRNALMVTLLLSPLDGAPRAAASKGMTPDMSGFGMDLSAYERTDSAGHWLLAVWTWSRPHADPATAKLEVTGAAVVDGPTARQIAETEHWLWRVTLKKLESGPVEIRGTLRVPRAEPGSYDYCENILKLDVQGHDVIVRENRKTEEISVRGANWFRYGGEYLVAIDSTDVDFPHQIERRPQIVAAPDVECPACSLSNPVEIPLAVTVGKKGDVTWIRPDPPYGSGPVDGRFWKAAAEGVRRYKFRPALSQGKPIADYAVVQVRIVPSRRQ
jgi:hypothetical protein